MIKIKNPSGQTLLEIVIAIGLATMILVALVILGAASLKTATSTLKRAEANKLAESGLEAARYHRDAAGFDALNNGCYRIDNSDLSNPLKTVSCSTNGGWFLLTPVASSILDFERRIEITEYNSDSNQKKVESKVR